MLLLDGQMVMVANGAVAGPVCGEQQRAGDIVPSVVSGSETASACIFLPLWHACIAIITLLCHVSWPAWDLVLRQESAGCRVGIRRRGVEPLRTARPPTPHTTHTSS